MVRKGGIAFSSDQCQPETTRRVRKTPIVVLERLNIPLNSTVLVKGDCVKFLVELPNRNSHENDVINISGSDNSEDEEFQKLVVKRFQSTRDNNSTCKQTEFSHSFESVSFKQHSLETFSSPTSKTYNSINSVKSGPTSHKKLIAQTNALKRKSTQMSTTSRSACKYNAHKKQILMRNNAKEMLESESPEKILERKIESAGFLNMSSINKEETAVSDKTSSVVNDKTNVSPSSFRAGKKIQSNKTNSKKSLNVEKLDTSSSVQTTSVVQERLTNPSLLEENALSNENIDANRNKQTPSHDETVFASSKPDFTPSRTSERIKNKKVKFSALRLLAGGDFQAIKRELNARKHSTPKKTLVKSNDTDTTSINVNNSSEISPPSGELLSTLTNPVNKSKGNKLSPKIVSNTKPEKLQVKKVSTPTIGIPENRKQRLTKHSQDKLIDGENLASNERGPDEQHSHNVLRTDDTDNLSDVTESRLNGSKEILMESSTERKEDINLKRVSDKIKLQLKGAPEKKIVNITVTPRKEFLKSKDSRTDELKQKLDLKLGPDIIIRRVRSEKKQINEGGEESSVAVENGKDKAADKAEDKVNTEETISNKNLLMPNNVRIKNLIYSKQSTKSGPKSIKEVEVPPQIKKLLVEASKNKKSLTPKNKETSTTKINQLKGSNNEVTDLNSRRKKKLKELHKKKLKHAKQKLINKSKIEILENKGKNNLESRKDCEQQSGSVQEMEHDDIEPEILELLDSTIEEDDDDVVIKECDESAKKSSGGDNKIEKNNNCKNTHNLSTNVGKKTAKVTPLRQAIKIPPTSEIIKKPISDKVKNGSESEYIKFQKSNIIPKTNSSADSILGSRSNYRNSFEKYFICSDKICEHNESLDSDSSCEIIDTLSHFVDIKKKDKEENEDIIDLEDTSQLESNNEDHPKDKHQVGINLFNRITEEKTSNSLSNKEKGTINEIIKGVMADLPRWNWHILPESSIVCLILLDQEPNGTLDVKKCIELDSNFKAKVYVNKQLINEYCGVYDSFDAIKNLIYQVDLL